ncbi:MAG: hypothetical protein ACPL88_04100 [Bryobacteraceae bacterium]
MNVLNSMSAIALVDLSLLTVWRLALGEKHYDNVDLAGGMIPALPSDKKSKPRQTRIRP